MDVQQMIDTLVTKATKETTDADSLLALSATLKQAVLDALASAGTLTPAQEAAVVGVFAAFDANDQRVADALAANVP